MSARQQSLSPYRAGRFTADFKLPVTRSYPISGEREGCVVSIHVMKACKRVEVLFLTFLNSELDMWSALHVGHFTPGSTVARDSLSFRLGGSHSQLGHCGEGKNTSILHCRESNPDSPIIQLIV